MNLLSLPHTFHSHKLFTYHVHKIIMLLYSSR